MSGYRRLSHWGLGAAYVAVLAVLGCGPGATGPDTPNDIRLTIVSGSGQVGTVGTALATALKVQATNSSNAPIPNLLVDFVPKTGGGAMYAGASFTDASGFAQDYVTLGPTAGAQTVEVHAVNSTTGVKSNFGTFSFTANAAAATVLTLVAGNAQTGLAGLGVPVNPKVMVTDLYGNPKGGIAITFTIGAGGGSVNGTSGTGVAASTETTAGDGTAGITKWTLGGSAGAKTLTAAGTGLTGSPLTFTSTAQFNAKSVATSEYQTCLLDMGGNAYCTGYNVYGQLGIGSPRTVANGVWGKVVGGKQFTQIATGTNHTCAISTASDAYCWGYGGNGQVGNGSQQGDYSPLLVKNGLKFKKITAGYAHTCGITTANAAYCWGDNTYGELGNNSTTLSTVPVQVAGGMTWAWISAGYYTTCGATTGNKAYCWGYNPNGQIGDGTTANRTGPTAVGGGLSFTQVETGTNHSCGITTSGSAYCWGYGANGALGNGSTANNAVPVPVSGGRTYVAINSAYESSCAIATTTFVEYCWGGDGYGELGTGGTNVTSPTKVAGSSTYASMSPGGYNATSCSISRSGGVPQCWGYNGQGAVVDGTSINRQVPVSTTTPGP